MPAGGKKERHATRHVRTDLCLSRLGVHFEQRPEQEGHDGEIQEEPRCRCEALRGECRQRPKLVGSRHLAQVPSRAHSSQTVIVWPSTLIRYPAFGLAPFWNWRTKTT